MLVLSLIVSPSSLIVSAVAPRVDSFAMELVTLKSSSIACFGWKHELTLNTRGKRHAIRGSSQLKGYHAPQSSPFYIMTRASKSACCLTFVYTMNVINCNVIGLFD